MQYLASYIPRYVTERTDALRLRKYAALRVFKGIDQITMSCRQPVLDLDGC